MATADRDLTADEVRRLFDYDADAGALVWRKSGRVAGAPAGKSGRTQITVHGVARYAHRLIWLEAKARVHPWAA
jgi:hypothetical protein